MTAPEGASSLDQSHTFPREHAFDEGCLAGIVCFPVGVRTGLEGEVPFQGRIAPGKAGIAAQGVAKLAPLRR